MVGPAHGSRITRETCPPKTGRHALRFRFDMEHLAPGLHVSCFGGSALFLAAVVLVALKSELGASTERRPHAHTTPQDRVQIFQGPEERALDWILASAHWSQTTGTHLDWDGSHRDSTATATTTQPHCSRGQQNRDSGGGLFQMPENDGCRGGASALFPSCHRNTVLLVPSKY